MGFFTRLGQKIKNVLGDVGRFGQKVGDSVGRFGEKVGRGLLKGIARVESVPILGTILNDTGLTTIPKMIGQTIQGAGEAVEGVGDITGGVLEGRPQLIKKAIGEGTEGFVEGRTGNIHFGHLARDLLPRFVGGQKGFSGVGTQLAEGILQTGEQQVKKKIGKQAVKKAQPIIEGGLARAFFRKTPQLLEAVI